VWSRQMGTSETDAALSVAVSSTSGIVVLGGVTAGALDGISYGGSTDGFVMALEPDGGSVLWTYMVSSTSADVINAVMIDESLQFAIALGWSSGRLGQTTVSSEDVVILRLHISSGQAYQGQNVQITSAGLDMFTAGCIVQSGAFFLAAGHTRGSFISGSTSSGQDSVGGTFNTTMPVSSGAVKTVVAKSMGDEITRAAACMAGSNDEYFYAIGGLRQNTVEPYFGNVARGSEDAFLSFYGPVTGLPSPGGSNRMWSRLTSGTADDAYSALQFALPAMNATTPVLVGVGTTSSVLVSGLPSTAGQDVFLTAHQAAAQGSLAATVQWSMPGFDAGESMSYDPTTKHFCVIGSVPSAALTTDADVAVVYVNAASGATSWRWVISAPGDDVPATVVALNGNCYVLGTFIGKIQGAPMDAQAGANFGVVTVGAGGVQRTAATVGSSRNDFARAMEFDNTTGTYVIVGSALGSFTASTTYFAQAAALVVVQQSNGALLNAWYFGDSGASDEFSALVLVTDAPRVGAKVVFMTGWTLGNFLLSPSAPQPMEDAIVMGYNLGAQAELWRRQLGSPTARDFGTSVALVAHGVSEPLLVVSVVVHQPALSTGGQVRMRHLDTVVYLLSALDGTDRGVLNSDRVDGDESVLWVGAMASGATVCMAGWTTQFNRTLPTRRDAFAGCLNATQAIGIFPGAGNLTSTMQWTATIEGAGASDAELHGGAAVVDAEVGGLWVTGWTMTRAGGRDVVLARMDA
jgi:hypothetical protein